MKVPRFSEGTFNERIAGSDVRKAFKVFAAEVLEGRHPQKLVIECRPCEDVAGLKKEWEEVAERLWRQLSDPGRQERPRYVRWNAVGADAMTAFRFVTDGLLADRSGVEAIRTEMCAFFQKLCALPHLAHLAAVNLAILDWNDFVLELRSRPDLLFRWFPSTRPPGLMPLELGGEEPPFRSFLSDATLPYYSRSAHAFASPDLAGAPPTEDGLLSLLEGNTGLIVTGRGGSGKTRLTWELGKRAGENGWLVVRASAAFRDDAVDELLSHFDSPGNALLLIDQLEAVESFAERVEHLERLNATLPHRVRYVASCRTSYYRKVQAIPNHVPVDVSPLAGPSAAWLDGYRRAVVGSVLESSGVEVTPAHLEVGRDVPLYAVFMAFLQSAGRTDDLQDFVTDGDLGSWFTRRIAQSLGRPVGPELAMLAAAFPMREKARDALSGSMRELSEHLAADGWIEKVTGGWGGPRWVVVHDVLADCVILSYLERLSADTAPFIDALFDSAEANNAMATVLGALQRIADSRMLQAVEWPALFGRWLSRFTPQWLEVARFLYSALLNASDDRSLVEETLRRWLARHAEAESAQLVSVAWLQAGGDRVLVEEPLRRWLVPHAEGETAHFVYVAWLGAGGGRAVVEEPLRRWLERHGEIKEAGLVYAAWLDAGGDSRSVEEPLRRWLKAHAEWEVAVLVYGAWLEAEGARGVVEIPLVRWLTRHPHPDVAGLSAAARLKRQRAFNSVRDAAFAAMARLRESAEGSFVSKALTKQRLPDEAVLDILAWCRHFARNEDALWRLSQLEERIVRPGVASEACEVVELVLDPWLDAASSPAPRIANNITRILAGMTHIADPLLRVRAGALLARWLRHPQGFDNSDWCPAGCVTALVAEVRTLIARGAVDMAADAVAIDRFADWKRHRIAALRRTKEGA